MHDEFVTQVRDLLDHLYDYAYLQETPLAMALDPEGAAAPRERMRRLRAVVLASIEALNPGDTVSPYSPRVRSYNVLNLHYVDRLTVLQVANELAMSERQVYRDLRQAEGDLATALWSRLEKLDVSHAADEGVSRLELAIRELNRLPNAQTLLNVTDLLEGAVSAVRKLGQLRGIKVTTLSAGVPGSIQGDRHTVRQVLLGALSYVVEAARPGTDVRIKGGPEANRVRFEFCFEPEARELAMPPVTAGLITRLGGEYCWKSPQGDRTVLTVVLAERRRFHVLVIDDNEGLIALFQRYLSDDKFRVTGARDGADGLRQAELTTPDAIVLDVLMPGQDGWEVLQQLRESANTQTIPVIVCSVLDHPSLAYSLGAEGYLPKPVNRQQLLETLSRCCPTFLPGEG